MDGVTYLSPPTLARNPAYSQLVVVSGAQRTAYIGGQNAVDASGAIVGSGDLAAQIEQILDNLTAALAAADMTPAQTVKLQIAVVQGQPLQQGFAAFQRRWGNSGPPPAITVLFVAGLAHPDFLAEIDAIAVAPL